MKKIYKFGLDCGRMGSLKGVFVAEVPAVEGLFGKRIHFGEILGKHSDISVVIQRDNLVAMTDDQEFIAKFEKLELATGTNPFHYLDE